MSEEETELEEFKRRIREHLMSEGELVMDIAEADLSEPEFSELQEHLRRVVAEVSERYSMYGSLASVVMEELGFGASNEEKE